MKTVSLNLCRTSWIALVLALASGAPVVADELEAVRTVKERPYPYELLGVRPGDPVSELAELYRECSETEPTSKEHQLRIQSPEGRVFDLRYEVTREIGDVGMQERMSNASQDHMTAVLATGAFEQRPLALFRVLKRPTEDLPEPAALKAQLQELYGPPSLVRMRGQTMTLRYAWGNEGFIPDLEGQPAQTFVEDLGGNRTSERQFRTCATGGPFETSVEYSFTTPREPSDVIMPGCVATYEITYQGGTEISTIEFALKDYELARQHQAEVDRQILKALSSSTSTSDMDL